MKYDYIHKDIFVFCGIRAKESLAIVAYTDLPEELNNNVISNGWFSEYEVEVIN